MTDQPPTPEEASFVRLINDFWEDLAESLRADGVDPDAWLDEVTAALTEGGGLPPPRQEARDEQASDETTPLPAAQARAAAEPDDEPL